ncbi:TetR/AcrR family transcriptional regulator [Cohnella faecalis]|uniref:TetR/AcrR family transcriptional regulator n=1 Tax=Cohnella faecalis TaxID=2315694 RepID=A0A398CK38_9BACL|nr:TetR/AcrR family transcriptional regulator [Cohnella faecalis]RIE02670.1 TetR/AcrR family transcriptional regulator [Cohnella faecalis]
MTPREDSTINRKEQILDAAAALFAEFGYYKTTTAEVARAIGVTQPYVFHFFKSKEALYLAVLERASSLIMQAFATVDAPAELLSERMGQAFVELLDDHRNEIMLVMMAYATPEPAIREYTRREFDLVFERVKERFEIAGITEPERSAQLFFGYGLIISMSEALNLPKLCPWNERRGKK